MLLSLPKTNPQEENARLAVKPFEWKAPIQVGHWAEATPKNHTQNHTIFLHQDREKYLVHGIQWYSHGIKDTNKIFFNKAKQAIQSPFRNSFPIRYLKQFFPIKTLPELPTVTNQFWSW